MISFGIEVVFHHNSEYYIFRLFICASEYVFAESIDNSKFIKSKFCGV